MYSIRNRKEPESYFQHNVAARQVPYQPKAKQPNNSKSRFALPATITIIVILVQFCIFHYIIGFGGDHPLMNRESRLNNLDLSCTYPNLYDIYELARKSGVDLVVVDRDILHLIDNSDSSHVPKYSSHFEIRARGSQEAPHKSIIHLAAINETSDGQPNLKRFLDRLKTNMYIHMFYHDNSGYMEPEVYHRPAYMFDDLMADDISKHGPTMEPDDMQETTISKIYTEFITHILILNRTDYEPPPICRGSKLTRFVAIHIFVLYNFEYDSSSRWIQPSLSFDETDKHKLLSYHVHSIDFLIPIEYYYIHKKRKIHDLATGGEREFNLRLFDKNEEGDHELLYINNSYTHCQRSFFNITGSLQDDRQVSNQLMLLDNAKPIPHSFFRDFIIKQLVTALAFVDVMSKTYGNFKYWITASNLLAYYKHCQLALMPDRIDIEFSSESTIVNLELGLFAHEFDDKILSDLETAESVGITMLSDWRKSNTISFIIEDSPNVVFYIYKYKLTSDRHQQYYATDSSMILNHKFSKRLKGKSKQLVDGYHVFTLRNLELCWTRIDLFHPFRVPCNINDHLKRIYINE